MDNTEVTNLVNKIRELATENENLRGTKQNAEKFQQSVTNITISLKNIIDDLNNLNQLINPTIKINISKQRWKAEFCKEIYEKMLSGLQITNEILQKTYGFNGVRARNTMTFMQKHYKLEKVSDGRRIRLFVR